MGRVLLGEVRWKIPRQREECKTAGPDLTDGSSEGPWGTAGATGKIKSNCRTKAKMQTETSA